MENTREIVKVEADLVEAENENEIQGELQGELLKAENENEINDTDALIGAWLHSRAEKTRITYKNAVEDFFEYGGSLNSGLVDLQRWQESLDRRYKTSNANKKLSAIRSLFNFAHSLGFITSNPASHLKNLKPSKNLHKQSKEVVERILTPEEVRELYDAANGLRDKLMIKTAYLLGLRIDELLRLNWDNFYKVGGESKVKVVGKNSKVRHLTVPAELVSELKELTSEGLIFRSYQGKKISSQSAHKSLKNIVKRTTVSPNCSWHWLRHSMVSHSLANGASLESVRKKAGHSSIAVTQVYWHETDDANQYLSL
jgi:integrase/recombinase XerD